MLVFMAEPRFCAVPLLYRKPGGIARVDIAANKPYNGFSGLRLWDKLLSIAALAEGKIKAAGGGAS